MKGVTVDQYRSAGGGEVGASSKDPRWVRRGVGEGVATGHSAARPGVREGIGGGVMGCKTFWAERGAGREREGGVKGCLVPHS